MSKRQFGDRRDAKRVKDVSGMNQILIDLKPERSLGELYINEKVDVTEVVKYVDKYKKKNKDDRLTYFHLFMTAIGKTMYNRPHLNRFIANRHTYEHNDVVISFVAKIEFEDSSEEVMILIPIDPSDNIFDISKKISEKVNSVRNKTHNNEGANSAILILGKLPNILRVPIVGLFKWCDKKGILPASLVKDNLYYSSMIVSNIGSLHCGGIYHNVTDFGTCSGLITIGEIKKETVKNEKGKEEEKYYCEFGVTIDERISDGYYFIKSIHLIEYLLKHPELLEGRADEKIEIK